MARTTISIPDSIKKQMDEVNENVNWSAVATEAFINKLGELASQAKEKNMQQIIQRLQASKQKCETAAHGSGFKYGYEWAKESAKYDDLMRLIEYDINERSDVTKDDGYLISLDIAITAKGLLRDENADLEGEHEDFWGELYQSEKTQNLDFLGGFLDGANKLYLEVADKLN